MGEGETPLPDGFPGAQANPGPRDPSSPAWVAAGSLATEVHLRENEALSETVARPGRIEAAMTRAYLCGMGHARLPNLDLEAGATALRYRHPTVVKEQERELWENRECAGDVLRDPGAPLLEERGYIREIIGHSQGRHVREHRAATTRRLVREECSARTYHLRALYAQLEARRAAFGVTFEEWVDGGGARPEHYASEKETGSKTG